MLAEQVLWEGSPSIKMLAVNFLATLLFAIAVAVGVSLAYQPFLHLMSGVSKSMARAVATNASGLRFAAVAFVLVVAGGRIAKLGWRVLSLRGSHYRLSNQRLTIESGVLSKTIVEVDLRTVDEIMFHQSLGERLMGLGEIAVVSSEPGPPRPGPGRAVPRRGGMNVRLVGVLDPRGVREKLRNAAYEATGNQVFMRST
jgi:hypothetical protein